MQSNSKYAFGNIPRCLVFILNSLMRNVKRFHASDETITSLRFSWPPVIDCLRGITFHAVRRSTLLSPVHTSNNVVDVEATSSNATSRTILLTKSKQTENFGYQMSDFKAKMHQIQLRCGFAPDPAGGAYSASPDLITGREGRKKGGVG